MTKPKPEQDVFFENLRREGIYKHNIRALADGVSDGVPVNLMREKKSVHQDPVKMCRECRAFISAKNFFSHKNTCKAAKPVRVDLLTGFEVKTSKDFEMDILSKFHQDEVGELCRSDEVICIVGYRHYMFRKHDTSKRGELRKAIMAEMRELGRLYLEFKNHVDGRHVTTFDMFKREHLTALLDAIDALTIRDDEEKSEKHGLKLNLNAVLMKSISTLGGFFCEHKRDADEEELNRFKRAYQYRQPERFSGARFQCAKNSMEKHRRPDKLPVLNQMAAVRNFVNEEIEKVIKTFNISQYTWLRSLVVTRLTLYNGRRGEEGARLQLKEWQDAQDQVWLPDDEIEVVVDEAEKYLKGKYLLAYLSSKGKKKFVPLLIPKDLALPISILVAHREEHGVESDNTFVFPTRGDRNHCYGWAATYDVSTKAGYTMTATANRHRLSTIYASLEMSPADRKTYLDHMGHQEGISQNVYQCPIGFNVLRVMGPTLERIDQGMLSSQVSPFLTRRKKKFKKMLQ